MQSMTVSCRAKGATTELEISGTVDTGQCRALREGLTMAVTLRAHGPIVIDLAAVEYLALAGLAIIRQAADEAAHAGRDLTIRNLNLDVIRDPNSVRQVRSLLDPDTDDDDHAHHRRAPRARRSRRRPTPAATGRTHWMAV